MDGFTDGDERHAAVSSRAVIAGFAHPSARTRPAATSSPAVSPWTPNALESFPPFVRTISASAVGVIVIGCLSHAAGAVVQPCLRGRAGSAPPSRSRRRSGARRARYGRSRTFHLSTRLGTRGDLWRTGARSRSSTSAKGLECPGFLTIARPGLEPGTPRFSDKCMRIPNGPEIPAHKRVPVRPRARPKVRKVHEMVGDVGHEMPLVAQ
jgi:hypothetical protein